MKIAVFRKAHFNAAHRLHNPNWSVEKNRRIFGLCNNPNYHGHNYELEVKLVGEVEFKNLNPTAENICYVIWTILRKHLAEKYDLTVRLYETPRNYVEYPA